MHLTHQVRPSLLRRGACAARSAARDAYRRVRGGLRDIWRPRERGGIQQRFFLRQRRRSSIVFQWRDRCVLDVLHRGGRASIKRRGFPQLIRQVLRERWADSATFFDIMELMRLGWAELVEQDAYIENERRSAIDE
jgi:hypothetical protein